MTTCHYQYYTSVLYLISIMLYSNHINPNVISMFDLNCRMSSIYMASHFYGFSAIENGWETSAISGTLCPLWAFYG